MKKSKQVGTAVGVAKEKLLQKQTIEHWNTNSNVWRNNIFKPSPIFMIACFIQKTFICVLSTKKILSIKPIFKPRILYVIIIIRNQSKLYYIIQTQSLKNCISESPGWLDLPLKNIISDVDYICSVLFYYFLFSKITFPIRYSVIWWSSD